MVKQQDSELPYQLFEDQGSDPSTPATGFSRIYTKADGAYHIDDAGTITGPFAETTGSSGGIVDFQEDYETGGDISVTSATVGNAMPTVSTLAVNGSVGDILAISINTRCTDTDTEAMRIDVKLTGSASRFLSSRTSTANNLGVPGWFVAASTQAQVSGTCFIELVANDLSAGVCTLTMCAWLSSAGNRPLIAGTNGNLMFQAVNMGQP